MFIDQYYSETPSSSEIKSETESSVTFTRQQASDFAKNIADDFNPLHDINAKRFCVPGDLLFSLVLSKYGVSQQMEFTFSGMVTETAELKLPKSEAALHIQDGNGKEYLSIQRGGDCSQQSELIDNLTRSYVTFSGHTFPHVLLPLLQEKGVMINPDRPMVIYQSMLIDLKRLDLTDVELSLDKDRTQLETSGKRGNIRLAFTLLANGETIGHGEKHMILSGLKPFEQSVVDGLVNDYTQRKESFKR